MERILDQRLDPQGDFSPFSTNKFMRSADVLQRYRRESRDIRSGSSTDSAITLDHAFEEDADHVFLDDEDIQDILFDLLCLAMERRVSIENNDDPYDLPFVSLKELMETSAFKRIMRLLCKFDRFKRLAILCDEPPSSPLPFTEDVIFYLERLAGEVFDRRSLRGWKQTNGLSNVKLCIREFGFSSDCRPSQWSRLLREQMDSDPNVNLILSLARETLEVLQENPFEETLRQIDLDLHRTMPNHSLFQSKEGIEKLRRILVAYCVHVNPGIGYCQAMNFIAGVLLAVFSGNEEESLRGLISIVEYIFPSNYFDHQLTGVRADQLILRDLLLTRLKVPRNNQKRCQDIVNEITSSLTINWFLSLFHSSLPFHTRLYVLDCFLSEGINVLFRFSLALINLAKIELNNLLLLDSSPCSCRPSKKPLHPIVQRQSSLQVKPRIEYYDRNFSEEPSTAGDIICLVKDRSRKTFDIVRLKEVAFDQITLPSQRVLSARRDFYSHLLQIPQYHGKSTGHNNNTKNIKPQEMGWFRRKSRELFGSSETTDKLTNNMSSETCKYEVILNETARLAIISPSLHSIRDTKEEKTSFHVIDLQSNEIWTGNLSDKGISPVGISEDGTQILCVSSSRASRADDVMVCHSVTLTSLNSNDNETNNREVEVKVWHYYHPSLETTVIVKVFYLQLKPSMVLVTSNALLIRHDLGAQEDDFISYCSIQDTVLNHHDQQHQRVLDSFLNEEQCFIYLLIVSHALSYDQDTPRPQENIDFHPHKKRGLEWKLLVIDTNSLDAFKEIHLNNDIHFHETQLLASSVISPDFVVLVHTLENLEMESNCDDSEFRQDDFNSLENYKTLRKKMKLVISLKTSKLSRVVCTLNTNYSLLDLKILTVIVDEDKRRKMKLFMNRRELHIILILFSDARLHIIQANGGHFISHDVVDIEGDQSVIPKQYSLIEQKVNASLATGNICKYYLDEESGTLFISCLIVYYDEEMNQTSDTFSRIKTKQLQFRLCQC